MAETDKLNRRRWQFGLLLALMLPVVGALFTLLPHDEKPAIAEVHLGATLSQHLLQSGAGVTSSGIPAPKFPPNYKEVGSVDDRYAVAVDSKTGETVVQDALGGVGTNNTSVEGDRARLAKDMLTLEHYADAHKGSLKPQDYDWLKRLARAGMKLAFGTPGLPPAMQPPIKANLLAQFHDISANPTQSLMLSSFFPQVEQAALAAENTYQAMPDSLAAAPDTAALSAANGSLLGLDPTYPPLMTVYSQDPAATNSLTGVLAPTLLVPSTTTLVASTSPTTTTSTTLVTNTTTISPTSTTTLTSTTSGLTSTSPSFSSTSTALQPTNTLTSTTTTMDTSISSGSTTSTATNTSPTLSASLSLSVTGLSADTTVTTSPSLTTTTAPSNTSTTTQTITVQQYYDALLGPAK